MLGCPNNNMEELLKNITSFFESNFNINIDMNFNNHTQIDEENIDGWRPRSPPEFRPQSPNESNVEVEEGLSVDDSQSSTDLSLIEVDSRSSDPEALDPKDMWGVMNGGQETGERPSVRVEVENLNDLPQRKDFSQASVTPGPGSVQLTPPKRLSGSGDIQMTPVSPITHYSSITPDSSKDSDDEFMADRKKSISFSPTNQIHHFTPSPDEFHDHVDVPFQIRTNTCGGTARLFLVVYALPFMYGASSNITTLYLLVELILRYKINTMLAGTYLALAYLCRVCFSSVSRMAPKACIFMGSVSALIGFLLIFASQNLYVLTQLGFRDEGFALFTVGSILANSNETISAMQIFVREQFSHDAKEIGQKLKRHYLIAKLARIVSFGGGGVLYHYNGVGDLAALGAFMVSLQIVCLIMFFLLDNFRQSIEQKDGLWGEVKPPKRCQLEFSIRAVAGRRRMFSSSMSKLNRTIAKYYPSCVPPGIVKVALPLCVFGRSISSMIVWSVSALIMKEDFGKNYIVIGAVFAGIMVCDLLVSAYSLTDRWNRNLNKYFSSPNDFYLFMIGMTLSLGLVAVPHFAAFVIGFMIFVCFNSALRTFLYQLQGSSESGWENLHFMFIRRFWTAAALFSIPMLDSFHRRLPLVLAIWFTFFTTTILIAFINCYPKEDEDGEMDATRGKNTARGSNSAAPRNRSSRKPERNLVYSEQVMLSRLIKGKDV